MEPQDVIAVDGEAAAGKSVCVAVAQRLGRHVLDTGAIYRAATWLVEQAGADPDNPTDVENLLKTQIKYLGFEGSEIAFYGEVLGEKLRTPEISRVVPRVSRHLAVRQLVTPLQREFATGRRVIAEGRDMGSVVFPEARRKFFLTAKVEVRAIRRLAQYRLNDPDCGVTLPDVIQELKLRDKEDRERPYSPLVCLPEAVVIDTSDLRKEEVIETMVRLCS